MQESPYIEYRDNVYRVAGTRVALDSIVRRFWAGDAPEAIVQSFPVLTLEQVYGAIKIWQRTTPVKVWVNAILTGSLRACSPQDKCKLP